MQGVLHHTKYCYCSNKLKLLYVFSQSESSSLNVVFLDLGPGFFLKNSEILMLSLLSFKAENILKDSLDLITFSFSENSNYGRESLIEM